MIEEGIESLDDGKLVVEFCGERHELEVGSALTFGRQADLSIDSNPYLHRVMGRFVSRQGLWWLQNFAAKTAMEIRDRGGSSRLVLLPRQQAVLAGGTSIVAFTLGPANYELVVERDGFDPVQPDDAGADDAEGDGLTIPLPSVPLSPEQHLLVVALAERRLRYGSMELPSNQDVASRLAWTLTKFNRKLDHLCLKLAREGIPLPGSTRRERLVSYAIVSGLVSADDLGLLPPVD